MNSGQALFWIGISTVALGVAAETVGWLRRHFVGIAGILTGMAVLIVFILLVFAQVAFARDPDGRYANSPLKPWFDSLRSGKGPCCSDADGTALSDVDWQTSADGKHYRVRINGEWIDVPDDAVITEPNRAGRTMVWPLYLDGHPSIRCFMPGPMT